MIASRIHASVSALRLAHPVRRHRIAFAFTKGPSTGSSVTTRLFSTPSSNSEDGEVSSMERVYQQWTLEQDRILYENRKKPIATLASMLGRGIVGIERRLGKIQDVNSSAYARLFSGKGTSDDATNEQQKRLTQASEILRRIKWDVGLNEEDFSVLYYDREENDVLEAAMTAPNDSIEGKETSFVFALPEHRIHGIKYKERIVWNREQKIDMVSGSRGGQSIQDIIESYDEWYTEREAAKQWNRQRQIEVSRRLQLILGPDGFEELKERSLELQVRGLKEDIPYRSDVENYVQQSLEIFREARNNPFSSSEPNLLPNTDLESLDLLSELVVLLPDSELRPLILSEILSVMERLQGKKAPSTKNYVMPELNEDDLVETFVRGGGAGGQKINKTASKVVLLHEPTQLRVECQDTRSLQQNRKIARKRLREKLDDYLNGSLSKSAIKQNKAASKKQRTKVKNRARARRHKQESTSQTE